jgi:hypothetical protein
MMASRIFPLIAFTKGDVRLMEPCRAVLASLVYFSTPNDACPDYNNNIPSEQDGNNGFFGPGSHTGTY